MREFSKILNDAIQDAINNRLSDKTTEYLGENISALRQYSGQAIGTMANQVAHAIRAHESELAGREERKRHAEQERMHLENVALARDALALSTKAVQLSESSNKLAEAANKLSETSNRASWIAVVIAIAAMLAPMFFRTQPPSEAKETGSSAISPPLQRTQSPVAAASLVSNATPATVTNLPAKSAP